jgi:hypothetical protein
MVKGSTEKKPRGYFSSNIINKSIPKMSTMGLRKLVILDKTEDPFENESGDIGVNLPNEEDKDEYNFTKEIEMDMENENEKEKESNPHAGGRRRRKTRTRKSKKSKKSKKRRRMSRKR